MSDLERAIYQVLGRRYSKYSVQIRLIRTPHCVHHPCPKPRTDFAPAA